MKNANHISPYGEPYGQEVQAILEDERLAPLRAFPDLLCQAIRSFYERTTDERKGPDMWISSGIDKGFFEPLGIADPRRPRKDNISREKPAMLFHAFLTGSLMPSYVALAGSEAYWHAVLDFFTRPNIWVYKKNARRYEGYYKAIIDVTDNLSRVKAYFKWLQDFFGGEGIELCARSEQIFFQRFFNPIRHHRMNRIFAAHFVRAAKNSDWSAAILDASGVLISTVEKSVFLSGKVNPLTLRNVAYALVEFMERAWPVLEKRLGHRQAQVFWDTPRCGSRLFFHWCWRTKRKLSLFLGLGQHVPEEFRQIPSMAMVRYLPACMLTELKEENFEHIPIAAMAHLAQGRSVRTIPGLPRPLSPRSAHLFANAPLQYGFRDALRYSIIAAAVKDEAIQAELMSYGWHPELQNVVWDPFFPEACRFFEKHCTEIETREIRPMLDYFLGIRVQNPQFSLSGRTPNSVRRQMEDWHLLLAQQRVLQGIPKAWNRVEVKDIKMRSGREVYVIKQITTQEEIIAEGAAMRHCVASYAAGCVWKQHSIWSLRRLTNKGFERLLTIQLSSANAIIQARGLQNRMPTPQEKFLLEEWCLHSNLTFRYA